MSKVSFRFTHFQAFSRKSGVFSPELFNNCSISNSSSSVATSAHTEALWGAELWDPCPMWLMCYVEWTRLSLKWILTIKCLCTPLNIASSLSRDQGASIPSAVRKKNSPLCFQLSWRQITVYPFLLVLKAITFVMFKRLTNMCEVFSYSPSVILPLTSCFPSFLKMRVLLYPVF